MSDHEHDACEAFISDLSSDLIRLHKENASLRESFLAEHKAAVDMFAKYDSLRDENARLREALSLIAAPPRADGTYNRCREACEQLAKEALKTRLAPEIER